MKKLLSTLFILGLFTIFSFNAFSQVSIKIHNKTGKTLYDVFATNCSTETWGNDILPGNVLAPEGVLTITIPAGEQCCFDFLITDKHFENAADVTDEDGWKISNQDVCKMAEEGTELELTWD